MNGHPTPRRCLRRRRKAKTSPQPHEHLPAYLNGFDVCFNPLAVNEYGDRRCPLRLYDYLATDKPIVSTGIREAFSHGGLVATFNSADEAAALIMRMVQGGYPLDLLARSEYIRNNTWEARASLVRAQLDQSIFDRSLSPFELVGLETGERDPQEASWTENSPSRGADHIH